MRIRGKRQNYLLIIFLIFRLLEDQKTQFLNRQSKYLQKIGKGGSKRNKNFTSKNDRFDDYDQKRNEILKRIAEISSEFDISQPSQSSEQEKFNNSLNNLKHLLIKFDESVEFYYTLKENDKKIFEGIQKKFNTIKREKRAEEKKEQEITMRKEKELQKQRQEKMLSMKSVRPPMKKMILNRDNGNSGKDTGQKVDWRLKHLEDVF